MFHSFRRNWATYLYSVLGQLVPSPPHGAAHYTHLAAALRAPQVLSFQWGCEFVKQLGWEGTAADLNFADKPFKNILSVSTGCRSSVSSHFQKQSNMHFYQVNIMQTNQMLFQKTWRKFRLHNAFQMFHICRIKMKTLIFVV